MSLNIFYSSLERHTPQPSLLSRSFHNPPVRRHQGGHDHRHPSPTSLPRPHFTGSAPQYVASAQVAVVPASAVGGATVAHCRGRRPALGAVVTAAEETRSLPTWFSYEIFHAFTVAALGS